MSVRSYTLPGPAPVGYKLDARVSVVMPPTAAVTNAVSNPSVELNTTGYTAVGGSTALARVTTKQRRGAYALQVTPGSGTGDGVYFGTVSTVAATAYPWSFDFWGEAGREYLAYWASTGGTRVSASVLIIGKGRWERVQVPYGETASTSRRLYVIKNGSANVRPFYIDGMLVVSGANDVENWRYFDGDTRSFAPSQTDFYWNGTPHGSISTMKAHARAAGRIYDLARYGFVLQAILGLGMAPPNNVVLPLALPGGEQFQRKLTPATDFQLVGYLEGNGLADVQDKHNSLKALLDVSRQSTTQTLLLQYEPTDACGEPNGEPKEIQCSFAGGLEGVWDNHYRENLNLKFRVHLPFVASLAGTVGAALDVRDQFTGGNVARRSVDGVWSALQTSGLNDDVFAIIPLTDGRWLIGGAFTDAGGDGNADRLAIYNPTTDTFSAATTAGLLTQPVRALVQLPDGTVAVGGNFPATGGFAQVLRRLNLSTGTWSNFTASTTDINGPVYALSLLPDGMLAVGGNFTNAGGDGDADYLARLDIQAGTIAAFNNTPLNGIVRSLATLFNYYLFVGGEFTAPGGFAGNDKLTVIINPSAGGDFAEWVGNSGGLNFTVFALRPLSDGTLLIGGGFEDVGGDSSWDMLISSILGPPASSTGPLPLMWSKPMNNIDGTVWSLAETVPGVRLVGGRFTSVAGLALYDALFQYSGSTLTPLDLDLPGTPTVYALAGRPNGELIVGFDTSGTASTSGTTSVNNPGSLPFKPVITISHPTTASVIVPLYSIRNLTTGKVINFNLYLLIGETLTIDLPAGTITSDLRGDLAYTVLPGSNVATFELVPGPNAINIFSSVASGNLPSAWLYGVPAFSGAADPVR